MRLCANGNLPADCVLRLRQDGHDVLWIRETAPGSPDASVLDRARAEDRLLITFDKDFGELVFRRGAKASHGIVLFRIAQPSASAVAARVSSCRSFTDRALTIGYDPESADMCELVNNPRSRNLLETELKSMGFEGVRVYFLVVSDKISTQSATAPSTVPSNDDVPV